MYIHVSNKSLPNEITFRLNMENIDSKTGFNPNTKTFHSLRPPLPLPLPPLSTTSFILSLLSSSPFPHSTPSLITPTPLSNNIRLDSTHLQPYTQQATNPSSLQTPPTPTPTPTPTSLTYTQLIQQVTNLSYALQTHVNLKQNHVAFILSHNIIQLPILFLSLLSIGVVVSPSNPLLTKDEISRQILLSKPVVAFATSEHACKVRRLEYRTIVIDSEEFQSMIMTRPNNNGRPHDQWQNQNDYEGNPMSPCSSAPRGNVSLDDVAAIFYSSGTTGLGKGVMITHRNLIAAIASHYAVRVQNSEPTVVLYTVPYFHIFGFTYCLRSVALKETAVVMERFEFRKMLRAVEEFRVTLMPVAPPVVVAMVKNSMVDEYDLKSLEWVGSGGAPLGIDVIRKFYEKFPNVLLAQGYALTETSGVASRAFTPEEIRRWGSAGKLLAMFEAKIVDPDSGAFLPPGRRGELWLRSPSIMKGYMGNAKATLEALGTDGWLRTGDICYFDDEGYLFVVDRLKELIKYKGYQVAPAELDELLLSHPEILDAAVIPYPDEEAGEVPMAFVVRHSQSSLDESEVMDFVAKQVAPYKKIRRVRFVTSIPKSAAGKILRKELRKIAMLESKI